MDRKHYKMMNWEEVEAIVYSDCNIPSRILGVHQKGKSNLLQVFYPNADEVTVILFNKGTKTEKRLEKVDDAGFFALFFDNVFDSYKLKIKYDGEGIKEVYDPYSFFPSINIASVKNILKGKSKNAYQFLGNKYISVDGVEGFLFTVYAPNADRVSLIGDFNSWNESANIMNENEKIPGLFSIFMPEISSGSEYKFSIKSKNSIFIKLDPYSLGIKNGNSVTSSYSPANLSKTKKISPDELQILEVDIQKIFEKERTPEATASYIVKCASKNCYNTVSVLSVWGSLLENYNVYNLFSVNNQNGFDFEALKKIVSVLSSNNISVLIDFPFAYVSDRQDGLSCFDGTNLYENEDIRKSHHSFYRAMLFDYDKPYTVSYIMSAANFYMSELDINGFVVPNSGVILYHDYNKNPGEYIIEDWGNTINSSGVNFIKNLNSFLHKEFPSSVTVASIYAYFDNVTGDDKNSLGFDYCLNTGASEEILDFICMDSYKRKDYLESFLKFTYIDGKDEKYIYQYSSKENDFNGMTLFDRMPGEKCEKLSNLKMAVIYRHLIKGSQLSSHDIDFVCGNDKDINKCFADFVSNFREIYTVNHFKISNYVNDLPFSYKCNETQVVTREYFNGEDKYLIVFNFSYDDYKEYLMPVSLPGVYTEVFNSDSKKFGGKGLINKKPVSTSDEYADLGENVINVRTPALSISAYRFRPFTAEELEEIYQKKKNAMIKYVDSETKKINDRLKKDIESLQNQAANEIKQLKELLKPYDR